LQPAAPQAAVVAAYRAKARVLHPDVPKTGNAEAFVAVKQAYDVLSNRDRRQEYDRSAQQHTIKPEPITVRTASYRLPADLLRQRPLSRVTISVLAGLTVFLCLSVYEATSRLLAPPPVVTARIRPNAATVAPLSPSAHRVVLYGPNPVRLAGTPNFYVAPAGTPAILWAQDADHNTLVQLGQIPPFSSVQAVKLIRQTGMLEVLVNDRGNGFISSDHLTPGDVVAARSAYCSYNAGPTPGDGELLERRGSGSGTLLLENRAIQPAVVKLRDQTGAVAVSVFLGPGGHADLDGLPEGLYRPEFAIGELWSRACNLFAAGMRARRMNGEIRLPGSARIVVAADGANPAAADITDQAFERE